MILTAVLAAQLAGTLALSDTSRTDARWTYPLTVVTVPRHEEVVLAWDIATIPTARLTLRSRRLTFLMMYAPTMAARLRRASFEAPRSSAHATGRGSTSARARRCAFRRSNR